MVETSENNIPRVSNKKTKAKKEGVWSETELKYFAIVLADDKKQYAFRLETLALKKSANNEVFEDIAKDLETYLQFNEFIEENEREKQNRRERVKIPLWKLRHLGFESSINLLEISGESLRTVLKKAPIVEPDWFTILNPVFSDTMGEMNVSSCSDDIFQPREEHSSSDSDKESESISYTDRSDTPNPSVFQETDNSGDDDGNPSIKTNSNSSGSIKRKQKAKLEIKPSFQKRVNSQAQAIQNMAKSFSDLGEAQQKRTELFAEKERQAEFLNFQREQADLNRQHEMRMLELIMRYTRPNQSPHQMHPHQMPPNPMPSNPIPPQQPTHSMYPYGGVNMTQYQFDQSQVPTTHNTTLTQLEPPSSNSWYEHN